MPPYSNDERVQGLHYLSVLEAAKAFVAHVTMNTELRHQVAGTPAETLLAALIAEVNRLSMFERRASTRGTVKETSGEDVERAVKIARERPDVTLEEREMAEAGDVEDMFSLGDEEPVTKTDETPADANGELDVFDV